MSSVLFESIQQSPIDPLFANLSSDDESRHSPMTALAVLEEVPLAPPTAFVDLKRRRILSTAEWIHQLTAPLSEGTLTVSSDAGLIMTSIHGSIRVSGIEIHDLGGSHKKFSLLTSEEIPRNIFTLYNAGFALVEAWRSRVVRLSMETQEVECSLMDDLFPPKSFLAEYRGNLVLRSMKIHKGLVTIATVARTVTVPLSVVETSSVGAALAKVAPELAVVDMKEIWDAFVSLRALCLDEDRRIRLEGKKWDHDASLHGG